MNKTDYDLRCFNCNRFAYNDFYDGDHGVSGYLCTWCIKLIEGVFK